MNDDRPDSMTDHALLGYPAAPWWLRALGYLLSHLRTGGNAMKRSLLLGLVVVALTARMAGQSDRAAAVAVLSNGLFRSAVGATNWTADIR